MKTTFAYILCSFIIVFASTRGAFVYHLGFPSATTYAISALLVLGFGAFSLLGLASSKLNVALVLLKNVVIVNVIYFAFFTFGSLLIAVGSGVNDLNVISTLYFCLVFPIVFVFLRYDDKLLDGIVYLITFGTVIGVFYFFNLGISGGFDAIERAHSILRPGAFQYSRIGTNFLPFGYAGSNHDTANILVMCAMFFLSKFFICSNNIRKFLFLGCYFVILSAALLTGSAANSLVLMSMSILSFIFYIQKSAATMLVTFVVLLVLFILITPVIAGMDFTEISSLAYVFKKLNPDTIPEGIWYGLDIETLRNSILSLFFGFGAILESPMIDSEVAFMSLLSRFGVLSFFILMFIGFSPIYYLALLSINRKLRIQFLKKNNLKRLTANFMAHSRDETFRVLMMAMPALTGFLTLIHYGSLFRITSIGLFCVLLAIFLKEYLSIHQVMTRVQVP
jgi:hypothetical protein